jgi:hypothetical protein
MVLLEELGHDNAEITKLNFFIRIAKDGIDWLTAFFDD